MYRVLISLLVVGLISGALIGCQLKSPSTTSEKTQESWIDEDSKTFSEELSDTVYNPGSKDSSKAFYAVNDSTRASIAFETDGTWEYKAEKYEGADSTTSKEDWDNDSKYNEGWVQTGGAKGSYTYDPETKMMTIFNSGAYYDISGSDPGYTGGWANKDEPIADDDIYRASFPLLINFDDPLDVTSPVGLDPQDGTPNPTVREFWDHDHDGFGIIKFRNLFNQTRYYLHGGEYVNKHLEFETGNWEDPNWTTIYTQIDRYEFTNSKLTHYTSQTYLVTSSGNYTDLSGTFPDKSVYTYTKEGPDYNIRSGNTVTISEGHEIREYPKKEFDKGTYTFKKSSVTPTDNDLRIYPDGIGGEISSITAVLDNDGEVQGYIME